MKLTEGSSFNTSNIRQRRLSQSPYEVGSNYNTVSPDSRGMRATNNVISQTEISQEATSFRTDSPDSDRGECVYLTSQSILGPFWECFRSLLVSEEDDNVRSRLLESEEDDNVRSRLLVSEEDDNVRSRLLESEEDDNVRSRSFDNFDDLIQRNINKTKMLGKSNVFSRSFDNFDDLIQRNINKTKMFGEGTNCNTVFRKWLVDVDHAYNEDQVVNFLAELYNGEFGQMTVIKQELIQQGHIHSVFVIMCDWLRTHSFDVEKFFKWEDHSYINHFLNLKQAFVDLEPVFEYSSINDV